MIKIITPEELKIECKRCNKIIKIGKFYFTFV